MQFLVYFFSFVFGCLVGSFLNVCIYRVPREMSVVLPPSHCPTCGQMLAWHDNVPILSFLCLGGRCRHCGVSISGRYALVEFLTGLLFLGTVYHLAPELGGEFPAVQIGVMLAVASALLVASMIDIERRIIPDEITIYGLLAGLAVSVVFPSIHSTNDPLLGAIANAVPGPVFGLIAAVAGAVAGGGFIYLTGVIGKLMFRKEAMGFGDVKLMAMVGAFFGWRVALTSIVAGCILGALIGYAIIFISRRKDNRIPFGPYLSAGVLAVLFFEPRIVEAVQWWQRFVTGL